MAVHRGSRSVRQVWPRLSLNGRRDIALKVHHTVAEGNALGLEFGLHRHEPTPKAFRLEAQGCLQPWVSATITISNTEGVVSGRFVMPQSLSNAIIHTIGTGSNVMNAICGTNLYATHFGVGIIFDVHPRVASNPGLQDGRPSA